jgi:hypothetical protein
MGKTSPDQFSEVTAAGLDMAQQAGLRNRSFGAKGTEIPSEDIRFGWIDTSSATAPLETGGSPANFNAVHVLTVLPTMEPGLSFGPVSQRTISPQPNAPISAFHHPGRLCDLGRRRR